MTFWDRLEKALYEKKMTIADLSRELGITSPSISGWKVRGAIPRADLAVKTAKILGTTVEYLIEGDVEYFDLDSGKPTQLTEKSFLVPFLDQELSAGKGFPLPDVDSKIGLIPVPDSLREYKENLGILTAKGDSMEPTISSGDFLICDSCGYDNGEGIYAIRLNGNGYVKRIQVGKGELIIKSDNAKYEPLVEPIGSQEIEIIGRVHYVIHHIE